MKRAGRQGRQITPPRHHTNPRYLPHRQPAPDKQPVKNPPRYRPTEHRKTGGGIPHPDPHHSPLPHATLTDGIITAANTAFSDLLGEDHPEDITGRPLHTWCNDHQWNQLQGTGTLHTRLTDTLGQTRWADIHHQQHDDSLALIAVELTDLIGNERRTAQLTIELHTCQQQLATTTEASNRAQQDADRTLDTLQTTREAERNRLAHLLHDGPLQNLTPILLQLDTLGETHPQAAQIRDNLATFHNQLRGLLTTLDPEQLGQHLPHTLTHLANTYTRTPHPTVSYTAASQISSPIDDSLALHIYRSVEQAVANAVEHANATDITISYTADLTTARWKVCDNGDGIAPNIDSHIGTAEHYGLKSLKNAATTHNGTLEIRPSPTGGTCIESALPLRP